MERLIIEAGDQTFSLELHPQMTVIAGVGPMEREGLVNEVVAALGAGRSGVHLEVASDAGARYAVFRPAGAVHRVVDVDNAVDVTEAFAVEDGRVDVLRRAGLSERAARRSMCLTGEDLSTRSQLEERILGLAHVGQARLWDVAMKVKDREARLADAAAEAGTEPGDAAIVQAIEQRHTDFEHAQAHLERVRRLSFLVGAILAMLAVPAMVLVSVWAAIPLLAIAVALTVYSALAWWRVEDARHKETDALRRAGAQSYLAFQINRVNNLIADDQHRRHMMRAAEDHRAAVAEWRLLVGDIPVDWALDHRSEVRQAADNLRDTVGVRNPMALTLSPAEETAADLAHALLHRLAHLRTLGAGGESFPLLLNEPLGEVDPSIKPALLELLGKASAQQQVILLTEDEDVANWARLESLTGDVALVEPVAARTATAPVDDERHRRRHVVA